MIDTKMLAAIRGGGRDGACATRLRQVVSVRVQVLRPLHPNWPRCWPRKRCTIRNMFAGRKARGAVSVKVRLHRRR